MRSAVASAAVPVPVAGWDSRLAFLWRRWSAMASDCTPDWRSAIPSWGRPSQSVLASDKRTALSCYHLRILGHAKCSWPSARGAMLGAKSALLFGREEPPVVNGGRVRISRSPNPLDEHRLVTLYTLSLKDTIF